MARREVVEVLCDRCKRKDLQDKKELSDEPEIEIKIRGKVIVFKDLDARCRDAVTGYVNKIVMKDDDGKEEKSADGKPVVQLAAVPAPDQAKAQAKKGIFG